MPMPLTGQQMRGSKSLAELHAGRGGNLTQSAKTLPNLQAEVDRLDLQAEVEQVTIPMVASYVMMESAKKPGVMSHDSEAYNSGIASASRLGQT